MSLELKPDTVARLMGAFRAGDPRAAGELVELFYPELRRLAVARMREERPNHTLQPTALVNELYRELIKVKALRSGSDDDASEKAAFLGLAGFLMKRLLIHHSRPLARRIDKAEIPDVPDERSAGPESVLEVDEVLNRLAAINPDLRTVVELRVFEGLTRDEIAERMKCGTATVTRNWSFARTWLESAFGTREMA